MPSETINRPLPMSSTLIRDISPDELPQVHMPACETRPVLKGQKVLVTGASTGIGRGIATALCAAGADVMINYVGDESAARAAVDDATHCGCTTRGRAIAHRADVSDESQVVEMFDRIMEEFGTIDILVNNAGLQQDAPIEEMTLAQ